METRREPGLCAGECFARVQKVVAENAALRQENAILRAQVARADGAVHASQPAVLEAPRAELGAARSAPPLSAETCKVFVSGLLVGSQRTFASEFTRFCTGFLRIQPVLLGVSVVGADAHGLSRAVVRLQSVAEATRMLEAGKRLLGPSCTVSMDWNRSRGERVARTAARRNRRQAQCLTDGSSPTRSLALAALFEPAALAHDVTACTPALASASASAIAALAALTAAPSSASAPAAAVVAQE